MNPAIELLTTSIDRANQMLYVGKNMLSATDKAVLEASRRSFIKSVAILKKHEKNPSEAKDTIESLTAEAQALFARIDHLQAKSNPEASIDQIQTEGITSQAVPKENQAEPSVSEAEGVAEALPGSQEGVYGIPATLPTVWLDGKGRELSPSERPE